MVHLGALLRDGRVARGLSVEDITQVTKVPRGTVLALESDDPARLEGLPAPVFLRGFVRAYAHAIGLDAGPLVRELDRRLNGGADAAETVAPRRRRPTTPTAGLPVGTFSAESRPSHAGFRSGYVLLVAVAAGLMLAAWLMVGGKPAPSETATARPVPALHERVDGVSAISESEDALIPRSEDR